MWYYTAIAFVVILIIVTLVLKGHSKTRPSAQPPRDLPPGIPDVIPNTREELDELITQHALDLIRERILDAAELAVGLKTEPCEDSDIPIGGSKLGGLPDLPPDALWPTHRGRTLSFLAQVNLAEAPWSAFDHYPLPESGVLSFWHETVGWGGGLDPDHADVFQVVYFPSEIELVRREYPEFSNGDFAEEPKYFEWKPFKSCNAVPVSLWTLDNNKFEDLSDEQYDSIDKLEESLGCHLNGVTHRLLGHPNQIQNEMKSECQLASNGVNVGGDFPEAEQEQIEALMPGAEDWRMLMQIDTDESGPGWMWGDCGCIYFWIRSQDLQKQDFSRVWGILQCY